MPQTRFVLRKALALEKKVIVVVNKIDRPSARSTAHHALPVHAPCPTPPLLSAQHLHSAYCSASAQRILLSILHTCAASGCA